MIVGQEVLTLWVTLCPLRVYMLKSQPPGPPNASLFVNRVFPVVIKMRSYKRRFLIQYVWSPYKKGKFGKKTQHTEIMTVKMEEKIKVMFLITQIAYSWLWLLPVYSLSSRSKDQLPQYPGPSHFCESCCSFAPKTCWCPSQRYWTFSLGRRP